jgi:hypothetical protein
MMVMKVIINHDVVSHPILHYYLDGDNGGPVKCFLPQTIYHRTLISAKKTNSTLA